MPLETAAFISDLNASNPAHTDGLSQADSHMRLTKSTLKNTFPNFTAAPLTSTQAQIDAAATAIAGTGYYRFLMGTAALPALTPIGDPNTGFYSPLADNLAWSVGGAPACLVASDKSHTFFGSVSAPSYSGGSGQLVPIGGMLMWLDDVLPAEGGYVWANGQVIANANTVCPILLARWGSRYGGNGVTTLGLPNWQEITPVGKSGMGGAASPGLLTSISAALKQTLGAVFGTDTVALSGAHNGPHDHGGATGGMNRNNPHGHNMNFNSNFTGADVSTGGIWASGGNRGTAPIGPAYISNQPADIAHEHAIPSSGSGTPHPNLGPRGVCNFIIRLG